MSRIHPEALVAVDGVIQRISCEPMDRPLVCAVDPTGDAAVLIFFQPVFFSPFVGGSFSAVFFPVD
jgi:hypothetical protein